MTRAAAAVSCFKQGCSCSQAILSTYGPLSGLDQETALRLAAGFGGGMGRMGETCGAVTAAFMVLGLQSEGLSAESPKAREKTYERVREFARRFEARNGSIVCRDLLGCDISTAEGFKLAREKKLISTICPKMVQDAAEILEESL